MFSTLKTDVSWDDTACWDLSRFQFSKFRMKALCYLEAGNFRPAILILCAMYRRVKLHIQHLNPKNEPLILTEWDAV
jgi:hypothetical protein